MGVNHNYQKFILFIIGLGEKPPFRQSKSLFTYQLIKKARKALTIDAPQIKVHPNKLTSNKFIRLQNSISDYNPSFLNSL